MITGSLEGVSNRETWTDQLEFVNDETDAPWFTTLNPPTEVTLRLRDRVTGAIVLSGSLTDGRLVIVADGVITFVFPLEAMTGLCAQAYDVGGLYTSFGQTIQFLLGSINVYEGL